MASGNTLFTVFARDAHGPATIFAAPVVIAGTSTPAEQILVLAFDQTTVEYADFRVRLPRHYAGGGLTVGIVSGAAVTSGGVTWEIAFRRIEDDAEDLDTTAFTYDFNTLAVATLANVIGEVTYDELTFTNGVDMDSLAVGEDAIMRIRRATGDANDTAAGDAYIHSIEVRET